MQGAEAERVEMELKPLEEIIRRYSHRMPFPERAAPLMALMARNRPLPTNEWELLALSLLASTSEPLFLFLVSDPGRIPRFIELTHDRGLLGFEETKEALVREIITGTAPPAQVMGRLRMTHLSAILVLDLLSILSFDEVTTSLSHLSDAIAWTAVYLSEHKAVDEMGIPHNEGPREKPVPAKIAFFALGKWGAEELNYASDIDMVAFFSADGETDRGIPNQKFFDRLARSAFETLSSRELMGGEFKVDFGLRPRGKDGSLTLSFPAALRYYRESARFWEKQAWIKARQFYGEPRLGEEFLNEMKPVVFSAENSGAAGEEIKASRRRMISNCRFPDKDLKEGRGSIRDIEFAVQGLQISRRGSDRLAERHTIRALHALRDADVISQEEESAVSSAYKTLRRAEHFAQAVNMRQEHLEPSTEGGWRALDRFLGVRDSRAEVLKGRETAAAFFTRVSEGLKDESQALFAEEALSSALARTGIAGAGRLAPIAAALCGSALKSCGRETALPLREALLAAAARGTATEHSLRAFSKVLPQMLSKREGFLFGNGDLSEEADFLLTLVSSSGILTELLSSFPEFHRLASPAAAESFDFGDALRRISADEPSSLRRRQKEIFFSLLSRRVAGKEDDLCGEFTLLAESILRRCFQGVISRAAGQFGVSEEELSSGITLCGLGRLGFREMLFGSDLDLLFVKDGACLRGLPPGNSHAAEKMIVSSLVEELTAITPCGGLYEVDLRLRPYGSAGVAVPSAEALLNYFSREARPWERLSYVKLRRIAGGGAGAENELPAVNARLRVTEAEIAGIREIIGRLRERTGTLEGSLKFGEGGLFEQDLLLLGKALSTGKEYPGGSSFGDMASFLESSGTLSSGEISAIVSARKFFVAAVNSLRIGGSASGKAKGPRESSRGAWDEKEESSARREVSRLIALHFPEAASWRC